MNLKMFFKNVLIILFTTFDYSKNFNFSQIKNCTLVRMGHTEEKLVKEERHMFGIWHDSLVDVTILVEEKCREISLV